MRLGGAAAGLVPMQGAADPADPCLIAVEKKKKKQDHLNNCPVDIPDDDPIWDINTALEAEIAETRALTIEGLSAQLAFAAHLAGEFGSQTNGDKHLYGNMQATLRAMV